MDVFKTLILDTPDSLENISGVLPVVNGGTGADNASDARVNLLPDYTGNANKVLSLNGTATDVEWTSNGAGDVVGPASSTDNAVARFDSTTGKVIQNSGVTVSDANLLTADALSINNNTTLGSSNSDTVTFNARIASEFTPATDNTYDLGRTGHEWRNLYLDGTANIDSLVADTADINGGTIDGTTIGATTPSTVAATSLSASTQVDFFGRLFGLDVSNETRLYAGSAGLSIYDHVGTGRILNLTQSSTKVGVVGTGDVATFTSTGLGIGLTAPAPAGTGKSTLDVNGPVLARGGVSLNQTSAGGLDFNNNDFRIRSWGATAGTGSMSFRTGGGGGSLDSEAMRITAAGNVGVGTTGPSTKLSVQTATNGGIAVNDGTVNGIIYGSTTLTNSFAIGTTTNHPLIFGTNNSFPQMTLATSGNVGVGTSTPSRLFTVSGATTDFVGLISNSTASGNGLEISAGSNSGDRILELNDKDGVERMRVLATGEVGIGITAPAAPLHVFKGSVSGATELARFQGGSGSENYRNFISLYTTNPSYWWETSLQDPSGGGSQNNLTFVENSAGTRTERMTLKSGGDAIFSGMTMPTVGVGGFAWDNASKYVRFGKMGAGVQTQAIFISATQTCGTITTNQTSTAYNTSSDYRLKENVVPMSDSLQRIGKLKPSRFNFISDDKRIVDGFIAHEVQEVVPEAISGEKNAMRDEEYEVTPAVLDDDGNEVTPAVMGTRSVPEYQGIDQSKLVPLLVGALQELTARLEALENN